MRREFGCEIVGWESTGEDRKQVLVSHACRRLFEIRGPLVRGFILEFLSTCKMSDTKMGPAPLCYIKDPVRRLCHRMIACTISGRGHGPKKVTGIDLFYLRSMDRGTTNVPYLLAQYLFRHAEGRKSGARLSGGHFIVHLVDHFGLVSDEVLREGPERQQAAAAGAYEADEAGPTAEKGAQEIPAPAPAQGPPPPPPAPQPRTMSQRIERIEEDMRDLQNDVIGSWTQRPSLIMLSISTLSVSFGCPTEACQTPGKRCQHFTLPSCR
ncbi:hypothetical protein Tco_0123737 [Tanacetum coccineum]